MAPIHRCAMVPRTCDRPISMLNFRLIAKPDVILILIGDVVICTLNGEPDFGR